LIPVTDIAQDMTDDKKSVFGAILLQEYIKDRTVYFPKLSEFLLYTVASSFLNVIMKNGADPNFVTKNDNTNEIAEFLNKKSETDVSGDDYRAKSKNLYELFFSSVPAYIEKHVEQHWSLIFRNFIKKDSLTSTYFHRDAVLANFELSLPLEHNSGTFKAVTFNGFFQAIRTGKVALKSLVVDKMVNTEQLKTQNNGKRKRNQDILVTAEGTDNDDDDDDVNKKPRRKKRKPNDAIKKKLQMTDKQYTNYKNNITGQSKKLVDMFVKHDGNYEKMHQIMQSNTESAKKLFDVLDKAYDAGD
jgi:hypothetical protein